jgi:transcriptional regulator with XRE-family HTH domain
MRKNSKEIFKEVDDFFAAEPTANQKAWDIIHDFYHQLLTFMEDHGISKSDLAKKLGKSRASITQLFNKNPNVTIKTLVEIADALGITISIQSPQLELDKNARVAVIGSNRSAWEIYSIMNDEQFIPCRYNSGSKIIDSSIYQVSETVH